jgi:hypothetical protein
LATKLGVSLVLDPDSLIFFKMQMYTRVRHNSNPIFRGDIKMNQLKNKLILVFGALLLAVPLMLLAPNVTVAEKPSQVIVQNIPLPVTVDKIPFQYLGVISFENSVSGSEIVPIPDGYVLELEFVNVLARVPAGDYAIIEISGKFNEQGAFYVPHLVPVTHPNPIGFGADTLEYGISEKVIFYSDKDLSVYGERANDDDSDPYHILFSLGGQLLPITN